MLNFFSQHHLHVWKGILEALSIVFYFILFFLQCEFEADIKESSGPKIVVCSESTSAFPQAIASSGAHFNTQLG